MLRSLKPERIRHIRRRRADLKANLDLAGSFDIWAESCVPSYCHSNWAAALLSWERLFASLDLVEKNSGSKRPDVLDFGASVGELFHLLPPRTSSYTFIEQDDEAATFLKHRCPSARQTTLESQGEKYDWIFAIDALEHNEDYEDILATIVGKLAPDGVLVLSGPTESTLYRIGRRLAGFAGGYHATNILEIESAVEGLLTRLDTVVLYPVPSFFRISAWGHPRGRKERTTTSGIL